VSVINCTTTSCILSQSRSLEAVICFYIDHEK